MRQSALPIALLIIRLIVVGYCSSTENDTAVGSTVETNEWEADLEADDVVLPQCVFGQDMKAKYGWLDYADFTAGKRAIIVEMDWWDSAILTSQIFTFLLIHIMGYKVNLRSYDGGPVSGSRLNHGNSSDVVLELWRSDASTWYEKYVQLSNTVISYGSVGYTGRVGLYFPTYMFDLYPEYDELDFWKSLVHPESRKAFPYSGTIPTILDEDGLPACDGDPRSCVNGTYVPAWYSESEKENFMEIWHHGTAYTPNYFQRLIDGLHLNATVNFLGESMYPTMMEAYNNRRPFLVYNWRPTTTVAQFNLTRVGFPEDTSGSFARFQKDPQNNPVAVDIPPEILFKASSSRFLEDFPELGYFMTKFQITDKHMQNLLASIGANLPYWYDSGYSDTTCNWIRNNEEIWKHWIPTPPLNQKTCPRGTGRYFSHSLWICLKCPPGTFNLDPSTNSECKPCASNALCIGGDVINVESGFWMPPIPANFTEDYVPELHMCPHSKQCCPQGNCTSTEICAPGFTGIFCSQCSDPSLFPWNGKCMECNRAGTSLFLTIFLPCFATAAILFVPKYHAAEIEQLAFYLQVINLIFDGNLGSVIGWEGINKILAIVSLDIDGLVLDCPLPIKGLSKELFRFLLPASIIIYFGIFYTILKLFPTVHQMLPDYLAIQHVDVLFARSWTILISFVFQPLIEASLAFLNCDNVQGINVVYRVPEVVCYSNDHKGPATMAFVVLIFLLLSYPLGLLVLLIWLWGQNRISVVDDYHFKDRPMDKVYEAFYMPYRPRFFYMESIVIWERAIIVLTYTFLNHNKDSESSLAYLSIFAVFGFTRAYIQPYKKLLQVYLNREIGIGFLVLFILRQYAKYEPEPLDITAFVCTMIMLPIANHALRWIRQGILERNQLLLRESQQGINPASEFSQAGGSSHAVDVGRKGNSAAQTTTLTGAGKEGSPRNSII